MESLGDAGLDVAGATAGERLGVLGPIDVRFGAIAAGGQFGDEIAPVVAAEADEAPLLDAVAVGEDDGRDRVEVVVVGDA